MNEKNASGLLANTSQGLVAAGVLLLAGVILCPPAVAEEDPASRVSGRVLEEKEPVSSAQVYAYDLATYALKQVTTDTKGHFLFEKLPAGLYKVIAHKQGFVPAVEMLLRRNPEARQFVELQLVEEESGDVRSAEGYWEARARIPADVLNKINQLGLKRAAPETPLRMASVDAFEARMAAQSGVTQVGDGNARLTDANLGVRGPVGQTQVELDGRYAELAPEDEKATAPGSEAHSMTLSLERPDRSRFSLATSSSDLAETRGDETVAVDLRHYRMSWSGTAAGGTSDISAQLIDESNYYNSDFYTDLDLPDASRTFNVQGSYNRDLTANTSFTTGMSYRQREGHRLLNPDGSLNDEVMGVFGVADSKVRSRIVVEYGLYSTMRGGELSLMPHGGMIVKLGSDWKARTSFAQRVESPPNETASFDRFTAAFYDDQETCRQIGETCYEVSFERTDESEQSLSVGAIHREFAENLRLYFSDDFFNRLESVLMVPGDQLPELQFRMVRHISPRIMAKLESNIASGGGGIFYATDDRPYENQVRYLVTSLDTRFQRTSTGVFLAFHHLEQELNPVASKNAEPGGSTELEIQRLQLMLTQDLSALANIAPSLAVRFNMELSRGATPYSLTDGDELQKKLTGGISLSF